MSSHSERLRNATCKTARKNPDKVKHARVLHVRAFEINAIKVSARVGKGVYCSESIDANMVSVNTSLGDRCIPADVQS